MSKELCKFYYANQLSPFLTAAGNTSLGLRRAEWHKSLPISPREKKIFRNKKMDEREEEEKKQKTKNDSVN